MPYIDVDAGQIYFESCGDGTLVLFLSQTGASGNYWKLEQVPYFSRDFRTIIFDYLGTGRSDRPDGRYSTREFASNALQVVEALKIDEPIHVVGHSMGGRVAQWFAIDYPDRVRSLVLFATGSGPHSDDVMPTGIPPEFVGSILEHGWPGYHDRMIRGAQTFVSPDVEVVERYVAAFQGQFGTDIVNYTRHLIARLEHRTTDRLSEIAAPTLVVVGEADRSPGLQGSHYDHSLFLAKSIPGVELVILPEGAHGVHVEHPERFNSVLSDFLARC